MGKKLTVYRNRSNKGNDCFEKIKTVSNFPAKDRNYLKCTTKIALLTIRLSAYAFFRL